LKQLITNANIPKAVNVFTLQSIKSRIETIEGKFVAFEVKLFLLYSPLNQGLKHAN